MSDAAVAAIIGAGVGALAATESYLRRVAPQPVIGGMRASGWKAPKAS